jgi:hypothetical protein
MNVQWLLLLSQLPPKQDALRVRVWRRLQNIGAVMIRNACWCLPDTSQSAEDFQWCVKEIAAAGGDALVCRSALVEGMTNQQVLGLFQAARDADYAALAHEVRSVLDALSAEDRESNLRRASKLRRQLEAIVSIDHGAAGGRAEAERQLIQLERALSKHAGPGDTYDDYPKISACRGKTWVTRTHVGIDRMASAWFIRKHIDPKATFRFISGSSAVKRSGELRFDVFDGEFTHRGSLCTFEVLMAWSGLRDPAMTAIAAIIHDLDLKDGQHQRPETQGVDRTIIGIMARCTSDIQRLAVAGEFFDSLHAGFSANRLKA